MRNQVQIQLKMAGACLAVAHQPDYQSVWSGQEPLAFGTELSQVEADRAAVMAKAALAEAATDGTSDAKAQAESTLEDNAFVVTRALAFHFKRSGDPERLGKADVRRSAIMKLRNQELLNRALAIRDLANAALHEPEAATRGLTEARVDRLSKAITLFSQVMNVPRGQVANRGALLKDIETDTASILDRLRDMDDLAVQFTETDLGARFVEAWKRARRIVDIGGSPGNGQTSTPSPSPLATAPGSAALPSVPPAAPHS